MNFYEPGGSTRIVHRCVALLYGNTLFSVSIQVSFGSRCHSDKGGIPNKTPRCTRSDSRYQRDKTTPFLNYKNMKSYYHHTLPVIRLTIIFMVAFCIRVNAQPSEGTTLT